MEIVIENPVESPPPPPPPPPPLQPLTIPTWNTIVTAAAPPTTFSSSSVAVATSTAMPATTTVMTITIAENPTVTPTYPPPVRFSYRETYAANSLLFTGDPYAVRRAQQPRGRSYDDPDGASPTVRRIDKSGLLGITEPETSNLRTGLRSPRFLSGMNTVPSGMLSPRRLECIGQLDPVPEVPGLLTNRVNVAQGTPNAPTTNVPLIMTSMIGQQDNRRDASRLDACETLSVVNLARPTKSVSFDSLESRHRIVDCQDVGTTLQTFERDLDGIESTNLDVSGYASSFQLQENCDARARTLGRLSRLALARNDRDAAMENVARYSETCCNFPFTVRAATSYPGFEGTSSLPSTRVTTTTVTTSTPTVAVSAMRETEVNGKQDGAEGFDNRVPEERAEAEGCEHGPTRNPLKDGGESPQRADEFADNDGIQTLRVIILSEQL